MESTITGAVESVTGRETSKGVIHDIVIGGKKMSAWSDSGLGEQANALQGSTVQALYEQKQNGQYTNLYLKSLTLADAGGTGSIPVAKPESGDDTAARIARSVAFEHLPKYVEVTGFNEDELFGQLNDFARWIYNGSTPGREPVAVAAEPKETTDDVPW